MFEQQLQALRSDKLNPRIGWVLCMCRGNLQTASSHLKLGEQWYINSYLVSPARIKPSHEVMMNMKLLIVKWSQISILYMHRPSCFPQYWSTYVPGSTKLLNEKKHSELLRSPWKPPTAPTCRFKNRTSSNPVMFCITFTSLKLCTTNNSNSHARRRQQQGVQATKTHLLNRVSMHLCTVTGAQPPHTWLCVCRPTTRVDAVYSCS